MITLTASDGKTVKNINLESVHVKARPGATVLNAIREAIGLAAEVGENVTLNHNDRIYTVCMKDLSEMVEKTVKATRTLTAEPESKPESGFKFEVGQRVRVIANTASHRVTIGNVYTIARRDASKVNWYKLQEDSYRFSIPELDLESEVPSQT